MTYSVVARDPASGALGVAVQSCFFAVGAVVPWARPGVGAVATQAFADPAYGHRCLDALAAGSSAAEALDKASAADPAAFLRQVGVVAADGSVAAHTGAGCIDHAGHRTGDGVAVQANMMASPSVWPAMADAYAYATGPRRLLAALDAAQAAGGDARAHVRRAAGRRRRARRRPAGGPAGRPQHRPAGRAGPAAGRRRCLRPLQPRHPAVVRRRRPRRPHRPGCGPGHPAGRAQPGLPARRGAADTWRHRRRPPRAAVAAGQPPDLGGHPQELCRQRPAAKRR
jgi:hypothetical protein